MEKRSFSRRLGTNKITALVAAILSLCLMGMLLCQGVQKAQAAQNLIQTDVSVQLPGDSEATASDLDLAYMLYKVADAVPMDGYDAYTFAALQGDTQLLTADQIKKLNDTTESGKPKASDFETMAQTAAGNIFEAAEEGVPVAASYNRWVAPSQKTEAGLYLLVPYGANADDGISPDAENALTINVLTATESADGDIVFSSVATSQTLKYVFKPQLVALPTKTPDENGIISTANPSPWLTSVVFTPKYNTEQLKGSIFIHKLVSTFEQNNQGVGNNEATFVFEINGYASRGDYIASQNDPSIKPVYSDVASMTVSAAGEQILEVPDVPMGLYIVVTEVYSGASYEIVGDTNIDEGYPKDPMGFLPDKADFYFENTASNKVNNGGSVTNSFNLGENGWVWSKDGVVQDENEGGEE